MPKQTEPDPQTIESEPATDWELLQIKLTPESWNRITWYKDVNIVSNPFYY